MTMPQKMGANAVQFLFRNCAAALHFEVTSLAGNLSSFLKKIINYMNK
jgi:hypothetical protein